MSVKTYSLKQDGDKYISHHFRVREFRCKDGTDKILIDENLPPDLEKLRSLLAEKMGAEVKININSGYRTAAHNKAVGGSSGSKHKQGKAADIVCECNGQNVPAKIVATAAQDLDFDGIGIISGIAVHVDCRGYRRWFDERKKTATGAYKPVEDFYAYYGIKYPTPTETVKKGDKGTPVRWVQDRLNRHGYNLAADGSFGKKTDKALRDFQRKNGLTKDGKCGRVTRSALEK